MKLEEELAEFFKAEDFRGKGALCVALVITQKAREGMPLDPSTLLTARGGQVLGLGKGAVQEILEHHGITRVLAEEGGRTSRGSIERMRAYVEFLNDLPDPVDLVRVEQFWIAKVTEHFSSKPFKFRTDSSLSIRASVRELLAQAYERQKDMHGSTYAGTMLQHLVGAKLDIILGAGKLVHHGASEADQADGRAGDFSFGDVAIHVTTQPSESLIQKCGANLGAGLRPLIVTVGNRCAAAEAMADSKGILDRIDILDAEQFLAANIHEWGKFEAEARTVATAELIKRYNLLIENFETDPSLKVELR